MPYDLVQSQEVTRLFFCHIPKTAGTTLTHILSNHFRHAEIFPYHGWDSVPQNLSQFEITNYRLYHGHFPWSSTVSLLGEPLASATMLRNPIERVLSAYHHIAGIADHPLHNVIGGSNATLERFIDKVELAQYSNTHVAFLGSKALQNLSIKDARYAKNIMAREIQRPADLTLAKERLEQIEFFGITELFDESMHLLSHTFHWEPLQEFESHNLGVNTRTIDAYNSQTIERLCDLNQLDLELYQFSRNLFSKRYKQLVVSLLWDSFSRRRDPVQLERTVDIQFDDAIQGYGWYPREINSSGRYFRWSGPSNRSTLLIMIAPSEHMTFTAAIFHAVSTETLKGLQIRINDVFLNLHFHFDEQLKATIVSADFNGRCLDTNNSISSVEFIVPETLAPNMLDNTNKDSRKLGLAIYWVRIGPTDNHR